MRFGGVVRRTASWVQAKTTVVGDRDIEGNLPTCPGVGGELEFSLSSMDPMKPGLS